MKASRSRNLFDRKSNKPFKISRSKFEAFLKCKKCFYIDRIMAVNFPSTPPYTLNNLVDELLKKEFDSFRKQQKPHPIFNTINFNLNVSTNAFETDIKSFVGQKVNYPKSYIEFTASPSGLANLSYLVSVYYSLPIEEEKKESGYSFGQRR